MTYRPRRFSLWCILFSITLGGGPFPEGVDSQEVERLASLGKLWNAIKYLHPYLGYKDLDWDGSLVRAIPEVMAASTAEEYAAAVQIMLDGLEDPVTRVVDSAQPEMLPPSEATHPLTTTTEDGIIVVEMSDYQDLGNWVTAMGRLQQGFVGLSEAKGVVIDVRRLHGTGIAIGPAMLLQLSGVNDRLVGSRAVGPGQRFRMHEGLAGTGRFGRGMYKSYFQVQDGDVFGPGQLGEDVPVVFLANRLGEVPPLALALQASGQGAIVAEGGLADEDLAGRATMTLADGVTVQYRTGELLYSDGTTGIAADLSLEPDPERPADALERAVQFARDFQPQADPGRTRIPVVGAPKADDSYPDMLYPDVGHRLLVAFRIYGAIEYFFAYLDLMDHDWDEVLTEFIPRFQTAANAQEYALTVSEMVTRIQDSHGFVSGPTHAEYLGVSFPPVHVRMVEDIPLVTGYANEEAAQESGIQIGDEILSVDGEDVRDRVHRLARVYAASNQAALMRNVTGALLRGPEGVDAVVRVRRGDGSEAELKVPRSSAFVGSGNLRTGETVKLLERDVGYVDLDRLTASELPKVMTDLANARAIVFDMRGYPDDALLMLATWLGLDPETPVADFRLPILTAGDGELGRTSRRFKQVLPLPPPETTFDGPTVMLIDERTQSSAEHTGLMLEAANGTRFVGSNSAGANGNVTSMSVPGGISVTFTGLDTRHGDGRQLQRVGLEPHLFVKPTVEGIRAGRDEVLEAAVEYALGMVGG